MLKSLPNTNIRNLKKQYGWLRRLPFTEEETRGNSMPVHIILGAADYQQIRTTKPLTLGAKPRQGPWCRVHNAQTRTIWKIVLSWCSRDCWHRSKTGWLSTQRISTATNEDAWWILWDQNCHGRKIMSRSLSTRIWQQLGSMALQRGVRKWEDWKNTTK